MILKNLRTIGLLVLLSLSLTCCVSAQELEAEVPQLKVFFTPSCHICTETKKTIMPDIEKEFGGRVRIEYLDIADIENYKNLLSLRKKYNNSGEIITPVFFFAGEFVNGKGDIRKNLVNILERGLSKSHKEGTLGDLDLVEHFKSFKPLTIVSAGLADGINPCAFTVIVFFISFLALQGYRKRELILIGISFIFAVFLTYLLLGLGLFNFLYRISGFWVITRILNLSIGVFSIILGCLSLYDLIKYKLSGSTDGMVLQLPQGVKNRIHSVIGAHHRKHRGSDVNSDRPHILRIVAAAFSSGFLVSLLEAVCTGQLYLPTIAFVLKNTSLKLHALEYLLLYNAMFVVPLLLIFLLALCGVTSEQFSKFLKEHLLGMKAILALMFFGLGIFLIWRF